MLKTIYHKKSGTFAILFIIICFVAVIVITGFSDVMKRIIVFNEIQSIMDVAGTSALKTGVDTERLKEEVFEMNEGKVRLTYKRLISSMVAQESNLLRSFSIPDSYIKLQVTNSNWGLGTSTKNRPQAILDVVAKVQVESSFMFDTIDQVSRSFYDSFNNENFSIQYVGVTNDGNVELLIRSVSRIVYR